jgi:hypothetical protein
MKRERESNKSETNRRKQRRKKSFASSERKSGIGGVVSFAAILNNALICSKKHFHFIIFTFSLLF